VVAAPQKAQVRRYAAQVQWSRRHRRRRCSGHGTTEGAGAEGFGCITDVWLLVLSSDNNMINDLSLCTRSG